MFLVKVPTILVVRRISTSLSATEVDALIGVRTRDLDRDLVTVAMVAVALLTAAMATVAMVTVATRHGPEARGCGRAGSGSGGATRPGRLRHLSREQ
jgi:hypothetical protein